MKPLRITFIAATVILAGVTRVHADYTFMTLDDPLAIQADGGTTAYGISGNTVVGSYAGSGHTYGFSETGGVYTTIDVPLSTSTVASGISGGTIVGYYTDSAGTAHGFSETGGVFAPLDDPSAGAGFSSGTSRGTFAQGISGNTIVGYYVDSTNVSHGFSETGGVFTTLDDNNPTTANGSPAVTISTDVSGISGSTIVGTYEYTVGNNPPSSAAVAGFNETSGVFTTNDFVTEAISGNTIAGWTVMFSGPFSITEVGAIETDGIQTTLADPFAVSKTWIMGIDGTTVVGFYDDASGDHNGFIATLNVPEPASLALLACGALALLLRRRRLA